MTLTIIMIGVVITVEVIVFVVRVQVVVVVISVAVATRVGIPIGLSVVMKWLLVGTIFVITHDGAVTGNITSDGISIRTDIAIVRAIWYTV